MPKRELERKLNGICILSTPQFCGKICLSVISTQIMIYIYTYDVIQSSGIHYSLFLSQIYQPGHTVLQLVFLLDISH